MMSFVLKLIDFLLKITVPFTIAGMFPVGEWVFLKGQAPVGRKAETKWRVNDLVILTLKMMELILCFHGFYTKSDGFSTGSDGLCTESDGFYSKQ